MINAEEEVQQLEKAVHVMHIIHKTANDVLNLNRLQGFQVIVHLSQTFKPKH